MMRSVSAFDISENHWALEMEKKDSGISPKSRVLLVAVLVTAVDEGLDFVLLTSANPPHNNVFFLYIVNYRVKLHYIGGLRSPGVRGYGTREVARIRFARTARACTLHVPCGGLLYIAA